MHKHIVLSGVGLLAASACVQAQELGTVVSATPVVQQVAVPRLVCQDQQVVSAPARSGAGAVVGAIAGGLLGSAIGSGGGQAAATAIGVFGGAVLGHQAEAPSGTVQTVQNCSTQTFFQNQTTHYDVVYEYAGRRYQVQMAQHPGATVPVQVTPVGSSVQAPVRAPVQVPARVVTSTTSYVYPTVEQMAVLPRAGVYYAPAPVVAAPRYSYAPPIAIGLSLGYVGGSWSRGPRHYGPPRHHHHHPRPPHRHRH